MRQLSAVAAVLWLGCGGAKAPTDAAEVATTAVDAAAAAEVIEDPNAKRVTLAASRLAAGRRAFDDGDFSKAMLEAQRGIDALGDDFGDPNKADSATKVQLAKARAEEGNAKDGATIMLRVLGENIELARAHWKLTP